MFQKLISRFTTSPATSPAPQAEAKPAPANGTSTKVGAAAPSGTRSGLAVAPMAAVLRHALPPGGVELLDEKIRRSLDAVPPLPQVAVKLLAELGSPESSARSVAALASQDTALAAAMLRTANSAAHAPVRAIASVQEAVAMMGFSAVRALLLRIKLDAVLGAGATTPEFEELWTHALAVSQIAEVIAPRFGADRATCSTLGLLHDLGKLVVMRTQPEAATRLKARGPAGESYLGREKRILGATHAEIGAHLASRWGLPAELTEGIRFHHAPQLMRELSEAGSSRKTVAIVHLANQMSKYLHLYSDDMEIDIVTDEIWGTLGAGGGGENDVEALIEGRVRRAATDAMLMAEAALGRPPSATGRVIRFSAQSDVPDAIDFAVRTATLPRIRPLDVTGEELFAEAAQGAHTQVLHFGGGDPRNSADTGDVVEKALSQTGGQSSTETRGRMKLALRGLVASAREINPSLVVDVVIGRENGQMTAYLRSEALRFERRFGAGVSPAVATRILDRECAGVINLQWFNDIGCSNDGAALRLAA